MGHAGRGDRASCRPQARGRFAEDSLSGVTNNTSNGTIMGFNRLRPGPWSQIRARTMMRFKQENKRFRRAWSPKLPVPTS
jgi:hypothetical protein